MTMIPFSYKARTISLRGWQPEAHSYTDEPSITIDLYMCFSLHLSLLYVCLHAQTLHEISSFSLAFSLSLFASLPLEAYTTAFRPFNDIISVCFDFPNSFYFLLTSAFAHTLSSSSPSSLIVIDMSQTIFGQSFKFWVPLIQSTGN